MRFIRVKIRWFGLLLGLTASSVAYAAAEDDPLLFMAMVDQLEVRLTSGDNPLTWDADAWLGKDLNKLWLKTEGERVNGENEEVELQLLYSRAVSAYWDFQAGWRGDLRPRPDRNWLAVGFKGLAPYFFEIDAAIFVGESGRTAARIDLEYEILFTQRLILTPEFETNLYGKKDAELGIGSGLSDIEVGLRLRYEFRREFAPYIGLNWWKKFGDTADFAKAAGQDSDDAQITLGLRAWF
ncbi:MAG: copper resistance protein B [Gammaproteobacteria bacterium]|nr:copper resistance protein B [Gammaproteobacteria bacterium]